MASAHSLARKTENLIETISGCQYEVWWDHDRLDWGLRHPLATNESQLYSSCYAYPILSVHEGFIEIIRTSPNMNHILQDSYHIHMLPEDIDRLINSDMRKRLENIIPAIVRDYEIVCDAMNEAVKKYGLPLDEVVTKAHSFYIDFGIEFDARNMSDEEILNAIDVRFKGVGEAGHKFDSWIGYRAEYSAERRALLKTDIRVPGRRGRIGRPALLVAEWPPNTGDPEKDKKIFNDVKAWLEGVRGTAFTPQGILRLVDKEVVLIKHKPKKKAA